ncbi:MAG TPA: hypothetical protein PLP39_05815 [Flavobacterium lutivivi]|nr:hypothetical protein [Flavobacterium lutivivi]
MKKIGLILLIPFISIAQIGINTTNPNAMLEIQSTDNGVLIPRVQLTSVLDNSTVVNPAGGALITSTLVYNIAAAGTAPNDVVAGFYYWNNNISKWIPITGSSSGDHDWYKVGTTTAPTAITDDMFHTGKAAIGTSTPQANALFHVDLGTNKTDGVLFTGTLDPASSVPNLGAGSRMMFFPGKSAFRAGSVVGTEWNDSNVGANSVAMGYNSIASGFSATALGGYSQAVGGYSTALNASIANGLLSTSTGTSTANGGYSFATGFSTANGQYSMSGGNESMATGESSFAFGNNTQAIGDNSVAMGHNSTASGFSATALGFSQAVGGYSTSLNGSIANGVLSTSTGISTANGGYSFATGFSTANGQYSMSGGNESIATGESSFAMGNTSTATGFSATALGDSQAVGGYSTALNSSIANGLLSTSTGISTANGDYSFASGFSTANGQYSMSGGSGSTASGNSSIAIGSGVTAQSIGEVSFGLSNRPYAMSASGATTFNANDHLFNLGNGNGSPHNALTVFKNGRLTINEAYTLPNIDGTANQVLQTDGAGNVSWQTPTSATSWLINGNSAITSPATPAIYGTSTIGAGENFLGTTTNNDVVFATNTIERMRVKNTTGNVGIGTATPPTKLSVQGNFAAPTFPNATSNAILRIGNNIEGLDIGKGNFASNYASWLQSGFNGTADPLSLQPLGGNVGIGTTNPSNLLHVNSATNGAVRIVDGTQGVNKVLTSDVNGVGTWKPVGIDNIQANLSAVTGISISYTDTVNFLQTGASITLPPGKYAVNVTMLLSTVPGAYTNSNEAFWVRSSFSDSSGANPTPSPDIIGSFLVSGNLVPSTLYSLISGMIVINNTSAVNKTYYYVAGRVVANNSTRTIAYFGGNYWAENNIIAYRLN